jgi:hypothetical protein
LGRLASVGDVRVQSRTADTLHVLLDGLRISFLKMQAPLLFPTTIYRGMAIADARDIAVMKVIAIGGRGSRKDFVDLCFILRSGGSLAGILELCRRRFSGVDYNEYHLLKSLVYFADAETEPMPSMIRDIGWDKVKAEILRAVRALS